MTPPFHIVLVEPDIPPNTGNIARLCAGTGTALHLIEPLGFRLTNQAMKRAGLDYWNSVDVTRHPTIETFFERVKPKRHFLYSSKGTKIYTEQTYETGDALIFGSETRGLPEAMLEEQADCVLTIPMRREAIRSLNLANSVAIVLYEAIRQTDTIL